MVTPQTPAGAARDDAAPAGASDEERAAQREAWRAAQASYRHGTRGRTGWRRRAARGTLPAPRAGMNRRPPPEPPEGNDAA